MAISAKEVMALRQRTGMGMMECKKALTEADGNADAAISILRKAAKGKMDERTDRAAAQGTLAIATTEDNSAVALVELNTETDFVARNDSFIESADKIGSMVLAGSEGVVEVNAAMTEVIDEIRLTSKENASYARGHKLAAGAGQKIGAYLHHNRQVGVILKVTGDVDEETLTGISQHVAAHVPTPSAVDESGLPAEEIAAAKKEFIAEAEASGKPPEIAEKISTGKLKKWIDERTLLGQSYVKDMTGKTTVGETLPSGATIEAFVRFAVGIA
jgi:elongation factor Ts